MSSQAQGTFDSQELAIAGALALLAQLLFVAMFQLPPPKLIQAEISNDNSQPIAVSITPVLKLGSKKPSDLPSQWQRRKPVSAKTEPPPPLPSMQADKTPQAIPTNRPDAAAYSIYAPDAAPAPPPPPNVPTTESSAAVTTAASTQGSEQGAANGTETDPLKAHAADMYRAQLAAWFVSRFNIRGKIPFEQLKALRAQAVVTVTDRKVVGFSIVKPSGDATFDGQVQATLAGIQSGGVELPAPPQMYPDMLGQSVPVGFQCTIQKMCE